MDHLLKVILLTCYKFEYNHKGYCQNAKCLAYYCVEIIE